MGNEALSLQPTTATPQYRAEVVAITSGKGGVGKTNIAANLAICLAALDRDVLLVDADLSLGNLDIIMDLDNKYNISHIINGRKTIEDVVSIGPNGVAVLSAASGSEQLASLGEFQREQLLSQLSTVGSNTDVIVIDTPAGISKSVVSFCLAADHVLVVTTPQPTAMADAYAMIKVLVRNAFPGRMSLLVNMAQTLQEGKKTYRQIANVATRFLNIQLYDAGVLLTDNRVVSAVRLRKPVVLAYPAARITASFEALAAKMNHGFTSSTTSRGFFKRVVNWLL